MDTSFKTNHLLLSEMKNKLRIRNIFTDIPIDDKKNIFGRLLAKERQQRFYISKLVDKSFNFAMEKN